MRVHGIRSYLGTCRPKLLYDRIHRTETSEIGRKKYDRDDNEKSRVDNDR
jgi:hypothetical protein